MELVSVIIPSYNRYETLLRAIDSVNRQTYKNYEILVVDDCSTDARYRDGTLENLPNTRVIHLEKNMREVHGVAAAQGKTRQVAIDQARGKWIAFLDDDDVYVPEKLEKGLATLASRPECMMCSSNMYIIGTGKPYFSAPIPKTIKLENIMKTNLINNSTVIISAELLRSCGQFKLGKNEDYHMWLRALEYTDCVYIAELLTGYSMGNIKNYNYSKCPM